MHIRYGFDIEIEIANSTTVITAFDVYPDGCGDIVNETLLAVTPPAQVEIYWDDFGNTSRRI